MAQREALGANYRSQAAHSIAQTLGFVACFKRANQVASFIGVGSEVYFAPDSLLYQHKQLYLPVINRYKTGEMHFASYNAKQPLQPNRFGIAEPRTSRSVPLLLLDCVLVPVVGFDVAGNRLGMGGGYYDRMLSRLQQISRIVNKPIYTIGVAFSVQQLARLEPEAHDMLLDYVVTEDEVHSFNTR